MIVDVKENQSFIRTTFEFQGEMPVAAILYISHKPHVAVHCIVFLFSPTIIHMIADSSVCNIF